MVILAVYGMISEVRDAVTTGVIVDVGCGERSPQMLRTATMLKPFAFATFSINRHVLAVICHSWLSNIQREIKIMSVTANKELVKTYFTAVNQGDDNKILALLANDFEFLSMHQNPEFLRIKWEKEQFAAAPRLMSGQMNKPIVLTPTRIIAEDDYVAAEAESYGEMSNGRVYINAYHFLFVIKNGLIAQVKEYSCSYTAADMFGGVVDDNGQCPE